MNSCLKILSLDVSSVSTGWSIFHGLYLHDYGTISFKSKDNLHNRMCLFKDTLEKIINTYDPQVVLIEDVWMGKNVSTAKTLAKFCGIAEETSYRYTKKEPVILSNKVVKGFFKCKSKEDLYNFIVDILDFDTIFNNYKKCNDITDSIAQALYYINTNIKSIREDKEYGFLFTI
jgi:Holliday junction resolvasome RuvABC endonuclease subunit